MTTESFNTARIVAVQDDLVTFQMADSQPRPMLKNEVVYICPQRQTGDREEKLKAEVLRVRGNLADAQVYESTKGVGIGDPVEQSGELLSVSLGPGLLTQIYDGLQNPLAELAAQYGTFLPTRCLCGSAGSTARNGRSSPRPRSGRNAEGGRC
jgi:V/A-type H+-transporting ATPase subunit A